MKRGAFKVAQERFFKCFSSVFSKLRGWLLSFFWKLVAVNKKRFALLPTPCNPWLQLDNSGDGMHWQKRCVHLR